MTASWTHWQRLEWLSEDTLLVHFPNPTDVATAAQLANLVQALFADRPDWLWDVTPGFGKLLVHYRPDRIDPLTLEQALSKALRRAVAADAQELGQALQGDAELPESGRHRRLRVVMIELPGLCAQQPAEVQRPEVAMRQLSSHRDQR